MGYILFTEDYPKAAPKIEFQTRMFHPRFHERRAIDVGSLPTGWEPHYSVEMIMTSLLIQMHDLHLDDLAETHVVKKWRDHPVSARKTARQWTQKHAMNHVLTSPTQVVLVDETINVLDAIQDILKKNASETTTDTQRDSNLKRIDQLVE
jgi:ubiquitin-conjugating enzyme E2 D/E